MLIVGHAQRLTQPLNRGQHRMPAPAGAIGGAPASSHGAAGIVAASSTGSGMLHERGAALGSSCRSQAAADRAFAGDVRTRCRLAGERRLRP
jgi:hypothetical protein